MRCDDVAELLPAAVDGTVPRSTLSVQRHIESCLRCQAELAQYRKLLRALQHAAHRATSSRRPACSPQILAALEEAGERRAVRSILIGPARSPTSAASAAPPWPPAPRRPRADRARSRAAAGPARRHLRRRRCRRRDLGPSLRERRCYPAVRPDRARRAVAQFGRAPVSKTGGWGFESLLPCSNDDLTPSRSRPEDGAADGDEPTDQAHDGRSRAADKPEAPARRGGQRRRRPPRPSGSAPRPGSSSARSGRAAQGRLADPHEVINSSIIVLIAVDRHDHADLRLRLRVRPRSSSSSSTERPD